MSLREKIIAAIAGGFVAFFVLYFLIGQLLLGPSGRLDSQAGKALNDLNKLKASNKNKSLYAAELKSFARQTLGRDELSVRKKVYARLLELLARSGLDEDVNPLSGGRRLRGAYKEVAFAVRTRGQLKRIIDLLYLLDAEPYLHRIDNITLSPVRKSGDVAVNLKFVTLVLEKQEHELLAPMSDKLPATNLDSELRHRYQAIAIRNLFVPYIKRVAPPKPPQPQPQVRPIPPQPAPSTPEDRFRVVGLPGWGEKQDVFVKDTSSGQVRRYKIGDTLANGKIVMVDYRAMRKPDKPRFLSPSRVIVKIGRDYWAVELGSSLRQKRRLKRYQLPPELRRSETPAGAKATATSQKSIQNN